MNVNEITNSLENDMVDQSFDNNGLVNKLLDHKNSSNSSSVGSCSSLDRQEDDLEEIPKKDNVAVQLIVPEKEESVNANNFDNKTNISRTSPVSLGKQQGKSILENFLTRPPSSPFHGLSRYNTMDNRKVEPLKINLHREPIKTVIKIPPVSNLEPQQHSPKITIKPLKPPPTVQANSETDIDQRSHKPHLKISYESNEVLKNNVDTHTETHIVPKLTIRNITHQTSTSECSSSTHTESFHAVVPKLTIKIDHQSSPEFSTKLDSHQSNKVHEKKNRQDEGMLTADGVKLTIKPIPEPPIPKLTIKTTPSDTTILTSNNCDALQLPSIQKLFIKPIQPESTEIELQSGSDENDSNENSIEASVQNTPIPKLTLKTNSIDRMVSSDTTPTVPKLILKMGGNKIVCRDDLSDTSPNETVEENDHFASDRSSPEQASSKLCADILLSSESEQIISLVEDSETESTEKVADLPPFELLSVHSVIVKPQSKTKASTIVHENPDSPRIILKINKSSTSEVKSEIKEPPSITSVNKDFNAENIVSSTITSEPETDLQTKIIMKTNSQDLVENEDTDIVVQSKTVKRTQSDIDSDVELDEGEPIKKIKFSDIVESPNESCATVTDNCPMDCTVISDEDTNDMKSELCIEEQKQEAKADICEEISEENYAKPEIETVCITIDDDSSSIERQQIDEDVSMTTTDMNQTVESIVNIDVVTDITPVKRGRGRPKKILQSSITKQSPKENELGGKEDKTPSKTENSPEQKSDIGKTPTRGRGRRGRGGKTVEIVKDGKVLQVKMDAGYEDDDSPTFSIYNRYATTRGRGRGGRGKRGMGRLRKSVSNEGTSSSFEPSKTPSSSVDLKVSLQKLPTKLNNSGSLQIFEEDTLMGGDIFQTPFRNLPDFPDESQSSQLSSASATNEGRERKRGKMEVCEPEGRTEFTVDMLAEYEWPPIKFGQKHRSSETYMVQEQISEYLGIKSFKRKYPDLVRRPVEMEERNFMMERGLVSEKMCDLGLTAVIASEILDIMCNDYPEKYEEYRRYQREKQFLEFSHRQKLLRFEQENKGQLQKDKAIETAASWNAMFNKERLQSRKTCIDLQTLVVHIPKSKCEQITAQNKPVTEKTNYPISLVPGQFSEFFKSYSAEELACYPVNTVLIHHSKLNALLKEQQEILTDDSDDSEPSENESGDSNSSSSESESSESSSSFDEETKNDDSDPLCAVCDLTQYKNTYGHPEIFIECTACQRKAHPTCIKMPLKMVKRAMEYNWKCAECKNCSKCMRTTDESKMLFCGQCDRGYHIYCLGLRNVPDGHWYCNICTICTKCGTKSPEGNPNPLLTPNQRQNLAMVANWTHLYRTNNITKLREHYQTLCVPCSRLKNA